MKELFDSIEPSRIVIAAQSLNRVIGYEGKIPWSCKEDLKRFRQLTTGHTLLMGRKTHQSIGRPLPDRDTIVLSRGPKEGKSWDDSGVTVASSLVDAFHRAPADQHLFIVGGERVYGQTLSLVSYLVLTTVHVKAVGDSFFPAVSWDDWHCCHSDSFLADISVGHAPVLVEIKTYERQGFMYKRSL